MHTHHRRAFLAQVGEGLLAATIGYGTAFELGLASVRAEDSPGRLSFGAREPLVALLQETPTERLMPMLVEQIRRGTSLNELLAAAALANARTFGGEDYVGFHAFMALAPAGRMASLMPSAEAALPVLKVLYRSSRRIQEKGGAAAEVLHPVAAAAPAGDVARADQLRAAVHDHDLARAEQLLAAATGQSPEDAYNELLPIVAEGVEVHRTVLAYRVWDLLDLVGREHALTLLRQSLHYCAVNCQPNYSDRYQAVRDLLPGLLDQVAQAQPTRRAEDAWVDSFSQTLLKSTPQQAAEAVAAALAEGFDHDSIADAVALTANQLVLRDPGRLAKWAQPGKPEGSVHGDSLGVHASDSINAWRHIARVSNPRNCAASLILSGWNVAHDQVAYGRDLTHVEPRPQTEAVERLTRRDADSLLAELDDAITHRDQERACAATAVYGQQEFPAEPLIAKLLAHGVADDGALHAEKYFHTATEEFARARAPFRWRHLVALARVTASQAGQAAPGLEEARQLLSV